MSVQFSSVQLRPSVRALTFCCLCYRLGRVSVCADMESRSAVHGNVRRETRGRYRRSVRARPWKAGKRPP